MRTMESASTENSLVPEPASDTVETSLNAEDTCAISNEPLSGIACHRNPHDLANHESININEKEDHLDADRQLARVSNDEDVASRHISAIEMTAIETKQNHPSTNETHCCASVTKEANLLQAETETEQNRVPLEADTEEDAVAEVQASVKGTIAQLEGLPDEKRCQDCLEERKGSVPGPLMRSRREYECMICLQVYETILLSTFFLPENEGFSCAYSALYVGKYVGLTGKIAPCN